MSRAPKVCNQPGCPALTRHPAGKCDTHRSQTRKAEDAKRPSTARRGYDTAHQRARRHAALLVDAGLAYCWRCTAAGRPPEKAWIPPGSAWDLGHDDHDRSITRGPEHQHCNRATASRRGVGYPHQPTPL